MTGRKLSTMSGKQLINYWRQDACTKEIGKVIIHVGVGSSDKCCKEDRATACDFRADTEAASKVGTNSDSNV
jgi:hypothetical protein